MNQVLRFSARLRTPRPFFRALVLQLKLLSKIHSSFSKFQRQLVFGPSYIQHLGAETFCYENCLFPVYFNKCFFRKDLHKRLCANLLKNVWKYLPLDISKESRMFSSRAMQWVKKLKHSPSPHTSPLFSDCDLLCY